MLFARIFVFFLFASQLLVQASKGALVSKQENCSSLFNYARVFILRNYKPLLSNNKTDFPLRRVSADEKKEGK